MMRHLYLYLPPEAPEEERAAALGRVKGLKPSLGIADELIQPQRAVPGSPGPILAWGAVPHFMCEYALVNSSTTEDGLIAALRHVLEVEEHPKAVKIETMLSRALGGEVRLIDHEEAAQ